MQFHKHGRCGHVDCNIVKKGECDGLMEKSKPRRPRKKRRRLEAEKVRYSQLLARLGWGCGRRQQRSLGVVRRPHRRRGQQGLGRPEKKRQPQQDDAEPPLQTRLPSPTSPTRPELERGVSPEGDAGGSMPALGPQGGCSLRITLQSVCCLHCKASV